MRTAVTVTPDDMREALTALQPEGDALPTEADTTWGQLIAGIAAALQPVFTDAASLLDVLDPTYGDESLPDWYRSLGLPHADETLIAHRRRAAILRELVAPQDMRPATVIDACERMGWVVSITGFEPTTYGSGEMGLSLFTGIALAFQFELHHEPTIPVVATFGLATFGDPMGVDEVAALKALVASMKPHHTFAIYVGDL